MSSRPAWSTRTSSRTARIVTQRNPVLKNKIKQKISLNVKTSRTMTTIQKHKASTDKGKQMGDLKKIISLIQQKARNEKEGKAK